mmetsp:Transcript_20329/g.39314  ORF Transcript_20329/g.39314 Transcript_20329/m.39314 type:complete len:305 (-) Transcript_20329:458-1372(-)
MTTQFSCGSVIVSFAQRTLLGPPGSVRLASPLLSTFVSAMGFEQSSSIETASVPCITLSCPFICCTPVLTETADAVMGSLSTTENVPPGAGARLDQKKVSLLPSNAKSGLNCKYCGSSVFTSAGRTSLGVVWCRWRYRSGEDCFTSGCGRRTCPPNQSWALRTLSWYDMVSSSSISCVIIPLWSEIFMPLLGIPAASFPAQGKVSWPNKYVSQVMRLSVLVFLRIKMRSGRQGSRWAARGSWKLGNVDPGNRERSGYTSSHASLNLGSFVSSMPSATFRQGLYLWCVNLLMGRVAMSIGHSKSK